MRIRVKIRDEGFVRNKAVYIALGILPDGTKDILGIWIEQTEGAKFWLRVMNELKNRGVGDFNPMSDRLRLMAADGTNFRVNPHDGAVTVDGSLAYEDAEMNAGETPAIVAAAYINSIGKPEATAMYDIDATMVGLVQQISPNDGTLAAIGKLGIDGASNYAFDIASTEDLTSTAYLGGWFDALHG